MSEIDYSKIGKKDKTWVLQYEALAEFKRTHGHCHVQRNTPDKFHPNHKLALWVNRQRKAHDKKLLPQNRKEMLDALDFYWNPNDYTWDEHYRVIVALKNEHGHVNIPFSTNDVNDSNRIYQPHMEWAKQQRVQHIMREKNMHNMMSDWRLQKLESIGFQWKPTGENNAEILKSLEKLADSKNFKWIMRKIPPFDALPHKVWNAIKSAKAEAERTGKGTPAQVQSKYDTHFIARESDGTLVLADEYDIQENRYENYVAFGPYCGG